MARNTSLRWSTSRVPEFCARSASSLRSAGWRFQRCERRRPRLADLSARADTAEVALVTANTPAPHPRASRMGVDQHDLSPCSGATCRPPPNSIVAMSATSGEVESLWCGQRDRRSPRRVRWPGLQLPPCISRADAGGRAAKSRQSSTRRISSAPRGPAEPPRRAPRNRALPPAGLRPPARRAPGSASPGGASLPARVAPGEGAELSNTQHRLHREGTAASGVYALQPSARCSPC